MKEAEIKARINELYNQAQTQVRYAGAYELYHGALSVMIALHGEGSAQVLSFRREREQMSERVAASTLDIGVCELARGAIHNLKAEIDTGFVGSIQQTITGEILTDFVSLSRHSLDSDSGEDAKNVAAVLAAAAFEDTLRRLAANKNIPHMDKLADVLNGLKSQAVLQGSQVGIANSYLNFRNNAMHAQWDKIDRAAVASVLAFVEQLLLSKF